MNNDQNNLLKRIDESFFFVVDADGQQKLNRLLEDCRAEIERQALAEPVEPVCWWNGKFYTCVKNEVGYEIPLYTTPPSVDALIAEAVAKEREACAELCIQMGTEPMEWQPSKLGIRPEHWDVAQAIRARGQK